MADALAWMNEELAEWSRKGLARELTAFGPGAPATIEHNGRVLINFSSNDYLGLASEPRVVEAACKAARDYGWGASGSPLVCGWRTPHHELAQALAEFEGAEAALLFPTGFAANMGAIVALVERGDAVYLDRLGHACLVSGARLSGASVRVFPHNDANRLTAILERERDRFRRVLIATEGVFSMDGDLAPLRELVNISERFDAMLLVDEAHGTGVFGPDGRGAASELGVADRISIRVGTLSKALGSVGGFVAGSSELIGHLMHRAPPFLFSTALPPAAAAAALQALWLALDEPWRRHAVRSLARTACQRLRAMGLNGPEVTGPIVPVLVGDARRAVTYAQHLRELGLLVPAIRPPTVPRGTSRLRISLSAAHTPSQVEQLVAGLCSCRVENVVDTPQNR